MQNNVLTEFIKSIATASDTFAGRFVLLEGYGNDANSDNNTEVLVGNALNAVTWKKKYPCILMMPPRVTGRNRKNSTVRYLVTLFFCTTTYHNGTGGVKALNAQTGTSKRSIQDDWNDMQTNANEFYTYMLYRLYSDIRMLQSIRPVKDGATPMDFFSLKNDDKISGVSMTFELDLVDECAFETFINNRVIIGDFIVLNSDAFLEWLVNQELGYRYAITEIIVNGVPDMGTYYSADYYAVNSQIIPVQIGERQTVPNYDDDSEVGFHYDKNIIDFLNSNFILNIFKIGSATAHHRAHHSHSTALTALSWCI